MLDFASEFSNHRFTFGRLHVGEFEDFAETPRRRIYLKSKCTQRPGRCFIQDRSASSKRIENCGIRQAIRIQQAFDQLRRKLTAPCEEIRSGLLFDVQEGLRYWFCKVFQVDPFFRNPTWPSPGGPLYGRSGAWYSYLVLQHLSGFSLSFSITWSRISLLVAISLKNLS